MPLTTVLDTPNVSTTTDTPDQTLLTAPKPPMTTTPQQPTPTQPSLPNLLPSSPPSLSAPPAPVTPTPPLNLSLMERLISNNSPAHAALWTPDALNRHQALHWTTASHSLHGPHPNHSTDSLLHRPALPDLIDDRRDGPIPISLWPPDTLFRCPLPPTSMPQQTPFPLGPFDKAADTFPDTTPYCTRNLLARSPDSCTHTLDPPQPPAWTEYRPHSHPAPTPQRPDEP